MNYKVGKSNGIRGDINVPPDKSISHRAVMFGAIAEGTMNISNFLDAEDCLRTINAFRSLGIKIELKGDKVIVNGKGLKGLTAPIDPIYLGNSGTSMRVIPGILAGQNFSSELTGDESLSKRPMKRIIDPLKMMGVDIETADGGLPPLVINGKGGSINPYRL